MSELRQTWLRGQSSLLLLPKQGLQRALSDLVHTSGFEVVAYECICLCLKITEVWEVCPALITHIQPSTKQLSPGKSDLLIQAPVWANVWVCQGGATYWKNLWVCNCVCGCIFGVSVCWVWVCICVHERERDRARTSLVLHFELLVNWSQPIQMKNFFHWLNKGLIALAETLQNNLPLGIHGPAPDKRFHPQRIWRKVMSKWIKRLWNATPLLPLTSLLTPADRGRPCCGLCPGAAAERGGCRIKSHKGVREPVVSDLYGNSGNSIDCRPGRKVYIHVLKLSPLYRTFMPKIPW